MQAPKTVPSRLLTTEVIKIVTATKYKTIDVLLRYTLQSIKLFSITKPPNSTSFKLL